jgi:uncharacterized RDD family membrane protein YckC
MLTIMTSLDVVAIDARVSRARFWRRVFAFAIDVLAVEAVVAALGLLLFPLTDGRIRVATVPVNVRTCHLVQSLPTEFRLPTNFEVTHAVQCTYAFFGHVHDRAVIVSEVTRSGALTYERNITFAVDADGRPQRAFYLDHLGILLFAGYLLLLEWRFGATLGKELLDMHVQSLGGGRLSFSQAAKRLLVRFLPVLILMPWVVAQLGGDAEQLFSLMSYFSVLVALAVAVALAQLINFIVTVRFGNRPWHDRWAGTEVVRGR